MRAVIQRVAWAKVLVGAETVGEIAAGLLVYLGVGRTDGDAEGPLLLAKVLGARIFANDAGKLDRSLVDVAGALLVVSQFTLYGDLTRGRRPGFEGAMARGDAEVAYEAFVIAARAELTPARVATGRFGASMRVVSENDGPLTLWLDSASAANVAAP